MNENDFNKKFEMFKKSSAFNDLFDDALRFMLNRYEDSFYSEKEQENLVHACYYEMLDEFSKSLKEKVIKLNEELDSRWGKRCESVLKEIDRNKKETQANI